MELSMPNVLVVAGDFTCSPLHDTLGLKISFASKGPASPPVQATLNAIGCSAVLFEDAKLVEAEKQSEYLSQMRLWFY